MIKQKQELNPAIFENGKLKNDVREHLLKIANDFYDDLEIDATIEDIILTGS